MNIWQMLAFVYGTVGLSYAVRAYTKIENLEKKLREKGILSEEESS